MNMGRAIVVLAVVVGCGEPEMVRLAPNGPTPSGASPDDPTFQVIARVAGARDPLPVSGARVVFADLVGVLGEAVLSAVKPRHDHTLTVELIAADASYEDSRLAVSLVVRATLRQRNGNAYVAQTQAVCREGAFVKPASGTKVIWACLARLGQDVAGWLEGVP
jgi:hypothetical protein